ncbi:MAG: hypothetical protein GY856_41285 [bacterium]|nr:hypothetical protein [bacterium]
MIRAIALFELRYQLRRPLLWLMFGAFLLAGFAAGSSEDLQFGRGVGNVHINAPFVTVLWLDLMSLLGLLLTTVFVAGAALRDFECQTHELFFSRPMRRLDYFAGRFIGAFLICVTVFMGAVVGLVVGGLMPWIDPEVLGPLMVSPYVWGLLVLALPNLFFCAAVFFSLASTTRSMLATYLGVVGFFAAYVISNGLLRNLDNEYLAGLLGPFGIGGLRLATKYWTLVEHNNILPELAGVILYNRLLWLGVATAVLIFAFSRFRFTARSRSAKKQTAADEPSTGAVAQGGTLALERLERSFSAATVVRQFLHRTRIEVTAVFQGVPFVVKLAFAMCTLVIGIMGIDRRFGTPVYPVTHLMVQVVENSFAYMLMIILAFYSGELIWRERSVKLNEIVDSLPVPNGVYLSAKLVAQLLVLIAFLLVGLLTAIGVQIGQGYYHLELLVYAKGFVVMALPFVLVAILASFLQVASGNKFLGYLLVVVFLTVEPESFDLEHHLYQYAAAPAAPYSDMNGYGHFVAPFAWFNVYWGFAAAILTSLAVLLWVRGTDTGLRIRLRIAGQRFRGPVRGALVAAVAGFLATGAWIFYNTNVLNEYLPSDRAEARAADYEKKYRQYQNVDLPRIADVRMEADIYPRERRLEARGRYLCVNRNDRPLAEIHLSIPPEVTVNSLELPAHTETLHDTEHGYRIYRLERPLEPGEEMELSFDLTVRNHGFVNHDSDNAIVGNGTFVDNRRYFPTFGYRKGVELVDRSVRREYDLPPVHRLPRVDDLEARRRTYVRDSDWIHFEATVSTSADQIAVTPGELIREWTEGDRRYFHYQVESPMLHRYALLSADYRVVRDRFRDVAIEIYYHESHDYNLDRMIDSIKKSLAYYTENLGPFQHRLLRIVEFPRYASFAQSFPTTVPYSEAIGFIAKLDDEDAIDYPFYITAHEVAHQWWIHQVVGGYVQGCLMLSEALTQYSALMVMEQEYGREKMRRFLKYELDGYLRGRGGELVEEMPLYLVETQPYIYYRKGSVVMYALRDYIGEELLNQALARYVAAFRFQQPPYTNTLEFLDYVREVVPAQQLGLIADLFETITVFENRVEKASFAQRDDGKYVVAVHAKARKIRADGQGVGTEMALDDWIDVGVFGEKRVDGRTEETVLYLEKRHVTSPETTFELVVDERPVRAGIDPYNKLIDRDSDDNVRGVTETSIAAIGS